MESKKYFKMYKSGKLWVTAAIVGFSVMAGMAVNDQQVKADTVTPVATTQAANAPATPAASNQNSSSENNSSDAAQTQSEETITRNVNFYNAGNNTATSTQQQTATVKYTIDANNQKKYDVSGASWSSIPLNIPNGHIAYINGKQGTTIPVNVELSGGQPNINPVSVIFAASQTPDKTPTINKSNADMYKQVKRTINVAGQDSVVQIVTFGRTRTQMADGTTYVYGNWSYLGDGDAAWSQYNIPEKDGYVSKNSSTNQFVTAVKAQKVSVNDDDQTVNIVYVPTQNQEKADASKKNDQKDQWHAVTRTINYKLEVGTKKPEIQTVWFKRDKITTLDKTGKATTSYTDWAADGDSSWPEFTIPQISYYHTEINGVRGNQFAAKTVSANTPDENYTVTYISDGTDPYNQRVVPGLKGNWASIDGIYMTDTGIHVTGWNANSDSYNRNYHYLIILDYGQNPVIGQFHEVGRKLVTGGVSRPDVFNVHPVWNAATSGFDDTVDLDLSQIKAGDKLRILSRWTSDPNGNADPADLVSSYYTMDYNTNVGNLDGMNIVNKGKQLGVSGWNATNQVVGRKYHYIILRDATTNQEIGRKLVTEGMSRPDVSNAYKNILNASKSGFTVDFDLSNVNLGHNLQVISRYSDTLGGEGSNVDYWFPARRLVSGDTTNYSNLDGVTADAQTGKVTFSGWNATNYSQLEPNRYIILYDTTANQQVDAIKLGQDNIVTRLDVQKAFRSINGAANSGFTYSVDMSKLTYGHTYALVSRYSSDANGNGNDGAYTDHWFNNAFSFNQQAYSIDSLGFATKQSTADTSDSSDNQSITTIDKNKLNVAGWMASDAALNYKNAYVLVLDAKTNDELGWSKVTLGERSDVLKAFPAIYNAGESGFNTSINLTDAQAAQNDGIKLVLRYTSSDDGNSAFVDQYTGAYNYNKATNKFVQA